MAQIIVEASRREDRGKNAARRLRVAGQVPARRLWRQGRRRGRSREYQAGVQHSAVASPGTTRFSR